MNRKVVWLSYGAGGGRPEDVKTPRAMKMEDFVETGSFGLSEGSVYERLRRHPAIVFDPYLAHAALIYKPKAAALLERVHREYLDVGQSHGLAMFALTDTW